MGKKRAPVGLAASGWEVAASVLGADFRRAREQIIKLTSHFVEDQEKNDGLFIMADDTPYVLDAHLRQPIKIDSRDGRWVHLLTTRYGLEQNTPAFKSVTAFLAARAKELGQPTETHRFVWYKPDEKVLYVSQYNGSMWRLDGENITTVPNGKGVLFLDDDQGEECPTVQIGNHGGILRKSLVDDLRFRQGCSSIDQQRILLMTWLLAIPFGSIHATKPLLLLEGEKGSGKSVAIQRIQLALTGRTFATTLSKDEESLAVQLMYQPISLLDNMDSNQAWVRDTLCTFLSGGGWARRKRYSDQDMVMTRPEAWITVTSRHPATFRRDDIADRTLILRMERRADDFSGSWIFDRVRELRGLLIGEWLWLLNGIVAALRAQPQVANKHRLADFAHVALAASRVMGLSEDEVSAALVAAEGEREALMLDDDPLVGPLASWLEVPGNRGRALSTVELWRELAAIATQQGGTNFYQNARSLAQRMKHVIPAVETRFGVDVVRGLSQMKTAIFTFVSRSSEE